MLGCVLSALLLIALMAVLIFGSRVPQPIEGSQPAASAVTVPAETEPTAAAEAVIPDGVTIAGVSVGGMTAAQAADAVKASVTDPFENESMVITIGGGSFTISPGNAAAVLDISAAVSTALSGTETEIPLSVSVDKSAVESQLRSFYDTLGGIYVPSGYYLAGDAPDMDTQEGECQTLVLNQGTAGRIVDLQNAIDQVVLAYTQKVFTVTLDAPGDEKEPAALDLDKIYAQVSVAAQNPRVDPDTLEVIPGKDGYGFDVDAAAQMLSNAEDGEAVEITIQFFAPEASEEDAWFQDTLGYYKTEYSDNENRTHNLELACEKLNGIILQPGETLSYNDTLGKRTTEAGYLPAPAYSGTELVDEVGGGICQVSSTLYLSSLFAELTIVERKNHGYPANYIPLGLDATVNWGTTDLKIRNDYDLPIKILAEVSDGYVKVRIMGVERRDYYVKMEYRVDDHPSYAAAYRCRYSRETDEEISRELDHTSTYLEEVWCWPGYAENAADDPT